MNCDAIRDLLPDRLDELLDDAQARAVDAHLAACPACSAERDAYGRFRAALYAPYPVAPLSRDLRPVGARRWRGAGAALLRYSAAFAAGALLTLAIESRDPARREPSLEPLPETPPEALVPRRIV